MVSILMFWRNRQKAYHDGSNLIGKTLHSVLEKEQADWFIEQINRSLNQDSIVTIEYKMCADSIQGIDANKWAKRRPSITKENLSAHKLSRSSRCSHSYPQHFQPPPSRNLLRHQSQIDALPNIYNRRVFRKAHRRSH